MPGLVTGMSFDLSRAVDDVNRRPVAAATAQWIVREGAPVDEFAEVGEFPLAEHFTHE